MKILLNVRDKDHVISTLGSHCSLQVLKGAKDEGFKTLLLCEKKGRVFIKGLNLSMIYLLLIILGIY